MLTHLPGEGKYSTKISLDIVYFIEEKLKEGIDEDSAFILAADKHGRKKEQIFMEYMWYKGHLERIKKIDRNHKELWMYDVKSLLEEDEEISLLSACKIVFNAAEKVGKEIFIQTPQRMACVFGIAVAEGRLNCRLVGRLQSTISDPGKKTEVRVSDQKKILEKFQYSFDRLVRDRQRIFSLVRQLTKNIYTDDAVESFLSRHPHWKYVK